MKFFQQIVTLNAKPRGFHLITQNVIKSISELQHIKTGMLHIFIQHTSASLTINENADSTVRKDFLTFFNLAVPENNPKFLHNYEGRDDMPAHLKSSLLDCSVTIPIRDGSLLLGTWQGIYLCEHRDFGGPRNIVLTIWGV